mmetsp:Transcript_9586/g.13383  ORF Transcript_9586/g.13383 Transcript_9586/m.13383 type:complete len:334 (+) Transcript_9586:84-1085(+)
MLNKIGIGYDSSKLKTYLKMSIQRLQMHRNKKNVIIESCRREVAKLLSENKEARAEIRTEQIIREDFTKDSYEMLEMMCDLLIQRLRYLETHQKCPNDLKECVHTVIWAADRTSVEELTKVKIQLGKKFGRAEINSALENTENCVNSEIKRKLSIIPPNAHLKQQYMLEIAKFYDIDWEPINYKPKIKDAIHNVPVTMVEVASNCGDNDERNEDLYDSNRQTIIPVANEARINYDDFNASSDKDLYPSYPPPPYVKRKNETSDNDNSEIFTPEATKSEDLSKKDGKECAFDSLSIPKAPRTDENSDDDDGGNENGKKFDEFSDLQQRFEKLRK